MNASFTAITILTCVIGVATPTLAAKPVPPPPPIPGNTSCNEVTGVGVFPAMVYSKIWYKVIKRGGGKTVYGGTDAFLADSNGMCSIWIGSNAIHDYRQLGDAARVAFVENNSIKVLKFDVLDSDADSEPDSISAISSSTVYTGPATAYGIVNIELSKDGNTIYFTDEYSPTGGGWQNTLRSIDIETCESNCPIEVRYVFPLNVSASWLSINDAGNRLYMSIHDRVPDIRTISILQKDDMGVWGSLRHVVRKEAGSYGDVSGFAGTALGRWEHNVPPATGVRDVLAFIVERASGNTTDIIDVTDCVATPPPAPNASDTCLTTGESFVVRPDIAGEATSFTSIPAGSNASGTSPSLLVTNYTVIELELSSTPMSPRQLPIEGVADSAD